MQNTFNLVLRYTLKNVSGFFKEKFDHVNLLQPYNMPFEK